jgi:plastocyanin
MAWKCKESKMRKKGTILKQNNWLVATALFALVSLNLAWLLAACGDSPAAVITTTTTAAAVTGSSQNATVNIDMSGFKYSPAEITITAGTTVVWTNKDAAKHDVVADDNSFKSPLLDKGATFSRRFDTVGTFGYFCSLHGSAGQGMFAKVIVAPGNANVAVGTTAAVATTTTRAVATTTSATTTVVPVVTTTAAAATTGAGTTVAGGQQIGFIFFRDDVQQTDQLVIGLDIVPNAPAGKVYYGWLVNSTNGNAINMGQISAGADGKFNRRYTDPKNANLLGTYDKFIITAEALDPTPSAPSSTVVFSGQLPKGSLLHIRHLLFSFASTPSKIGLIFGMRGQTSEMRRHTEFMRDFYNGNDLAGMKREAEFLVNIIEGSKGQNYGDLNKDGQVQQSGDGYGLLRNGDQLGYIEGTKEHAGLAAKAEDATEDIKLHAGHVMITAENVQGWVTAIRDRSLNVLKATDLKATEPLMREILALGNNSLNGVDLKGDGQIMPIPGSGGAITSYQHAQLMAAIPLTSGGTPVAVTGTAQTSAAAHNHTDTPKPAVTTTAPANANNGAIGGPGQEIKMDITQFKFSKNPITIKVGTKVTWTNQNTAPHTATADNSSWDSGTLQKGQSFSFVFNKAGLVKYHCEIHPSMTATINVVE